MKIKMIGYILLIVILLAAFLLYSALRVRFAPSVSVTKPDSNNASDISRLYQHVEYLSITIGSRSIFEYEKIEAAKHYIVSTLEHMGLTPSLQHFEYDQKKYSNIIVTVKGNATPDETVIIGAHYDTVYGTPGADDNASAVAVLLELCRVLKNVSPERTVKFIFFTLEEPPAFRTESMGSYVYAKRAQERGERIQAMLCLEMVGYYNDRKRGQSFPLPFMSLMYPSTPNFIAVVGNLASRSLTKKVAASIRKSSPIPVETLSTVSTVPGVDFSDHRSFWLMGYKAVMITDTAFYRNPNYHGERDTIDTLDFAKMSCLLAGLVCAVKDLVSAEE
jgi:hypothetical protein